MRIDELRRTLHEHGDGIEAAGPAARLQEVHGRIRTARRRRATVAVGGTAAAVAAVALAVVPNLQPDQAPAPAGPDRVAGYSKDGVTFRDEVLGERLLGAVIGDPGESQVKTEVVVGEEGLRFSPTCYGVGPDHSVTYSLGGSPVGAVSCQQVPDPDPGADGVTLDATPERMRRDWNLEPGDTASFVLRLVASEDSDGPTVHVPEAVIGGGVYEDTRPTRVVAGVEVPELLEHDGRVWELAGTYESDPGSRRNHIWSDEVDGAAEDQLTVVAASGLRGRAAFDVLVDGEVVESSERHLEEGSPTWQVVQVVDRGTVYDLETRVTEGLTGRTRLAFVHYWPR